MTSSDSAEQEGAGSGMAYRGSTQKPGVAKFYPLALVSFLIVACIVITSLHNLLDTPLLAVFGIGKKYQVSTYGIDDPSTAALVMENDSP
ncbi:MAG: hypothetical protein RBT47_10730, partial [Anaerolineae bacterium]|nr:hypothetical protein [Anaerolineae bacterium]